MMATVRRILAFVRDHPALAVVVLVVLGFVGGYSAGRRGAPARTEERERTEVAATATATATERREERRAAETVRRTVRLDPATGRPVERTTERTREVAGVTAAVESQARAEVRTLTLVERVTEYQRATFRLRLDAGWRSLQARPDFWGGAAELRIAGPLWLGAGYGSDRAVRLSVAWEF